MGYIFDAWLDQGAPRLRIINPDNGAISLAWDCPNLDALDEVYRKEIQNLFKRLLLLASAQDTCRHHVDSTAQQQEHHYEY